MTPHSHSQLKAAIADRYVFDDVLGQGAMGIVYLARDVKHGRQVAVKVLNPESMSGVQGKGFLKEIRLTARLQHPHVLPLLDSGEEADCPYYVTPFVKGGSLRELLDRKRRLSVREATEILRGITEALAYAHANRIVHLDIKPENVLLCDGHAVLADFGLSRAVRVEQGGWKAAIDTSAGTAAYVSPEQASGDHDVGAHSDLYSLACMAFEMLTGRAPFVGSTDMEVVAKRFTMSPPDVRQFAGHLPPKLAAVLRRAMAREPWRRYKSVKRFFAIFEAAAKQRSRIREVVALSRSRFSRILIRLRRKRPPTYARRILEQSRRKIAEAQQTTGESLRRLSGAADALER